jgi:hypothetical protein
MEKEKRTWVIPTNIRRGEPDENGRSLYYERRWRHFTLKMDDYRFTRWIASHDTNGSQNNGTSFDIDSDGAINWKLSEADKRFEDLAEKIHDNGWNTLTDNEKEEFNGRDLRDIAIAPIQDGISLEGWARFEGGVGKESITAFAVENDPEYHGSDFDENYERTFTKARVLILAAKEETPGSIFLWKEMMRPYSLDWMPEEKGDVLYIQFHMLPDKLKTFSREVAAQPVRPTLTLHAQGLLFRDEVEDSLSESWHPSEYVIVYDHRHTAILNSIRFDIQTGAPQAVPADEDEDVAPVAAPPPEAVPSLPDAVAKNLRGLKQAVWILAAAVVLAAFIH